jgi:hypothetical protein
MSNKKPYIVKFSGGRSSAMMLMKLLKNNQLNPKVHTLETILGKNPLREIISSNTSPL